MPKRPLTSRQIWVKYGADIERGIRVRTIRAPRAFCCYRCHRKHKYRQRQFRITYRAEKRNQWGMMTRWYTRTYCERCYYRWLIVEHERLRWIA